MLVKFNSNTTIVSINHIYVLTQRSYLLHSNTTIVSINLGFSSKDYDRKDYSNTTIVSINHFYVIQPNCAGGFKYNYCFY